MRYFNLVCGVVMVSALVCAAQVAQAIQFQSNLLMHFDAANVQTSGSSVTRWYNQGTAGATLDALPDVNSPLSVSSVAAVNNQPVVRFNNATVQTLRTGPLGSDVNQPLTIFHVGMMTSTSGAPFFYDGRIDGKRAAYYHASASTESIFAGAATVSGAGAAPNVFNHVAAIYNGTQSFINKNGSPLIGPGSIGTNPIDGLTIAGRFTSNRMSGDIAEIAVFTGLMNAAELQITSNHFSAKYQLPVGTNLYDGDNNGAGGYDFNVFGIGSSGAITGFAAGTVTSGTEGRGLILNSTGGLDAGDFVLAGEQGLDNGLTEVDAPAGIVRWERVWNIDQTGSSNVQLEFNSVDAGLGALDVNRSYQLLYSSTDPFDFSVLSETFSISGDSVMFNLTGAQLSDGFYTLGIVVPPVPEPSTFGLLAVMICGMISTRKRARNA